MSKNCTFTCDKCGKTFNYKNVQYSADHKDMREIEIKFGQYNTKKFDLCINCCKELGFVKKESVKEQPINEIDNFLDILADLVRERID